MFISKLIYTELISYQLPVPGDMRVSLLASPNMPRSFSPFPVYEDYLHPLLVHLPGNSFASRRFRSHGIAMMPDILRANGESSWPLIPGLLPFDRSAAYPASARRCNPGLPAGRQPPNPDIPKPAFSRPGIAVLARAPPHYRLSFFRNFLGRSSAAVLRDISRYVHFRDDLDSFKTEKSPLSPVITDPSLSSFARGPLKSGLDTDGIAQ